MYHNQLDYGNVPYPAPGYERATVKSGGCGVVAMAMALEDLLGRPMDIPQLARYAIEQQARISGGTHMDTLCRSVARDYKLAYSTSGTLADMLAAIDRRGAVIVNVGGDGPDYTGLFSTGGHYVYAWMRQGESVTLWDPGYYSGKFNLPGRRGKVQVAFPDLIAQASDVHRDAQSRAPRYYILENPANESFEEAPEMIYQQLSDLPPWARPTVEKLVSKGWLQGDGTGLNLNETMLRLLVINDRAGLYDLT